MVGLVQEDDAILVDQKNVAFILTTTDPDNNKLGAAVIVNIVDLQKVIEV